MQRYPPTEINLKKTFAALALAALIPMTSAHAAVVSFSNSIGMMETNWSETLGFNKFDSKLGTLTSIRFDLGGVVQGIGEAESRDKKASIVTLTLGSLLDLTRPDGSKLVIANPVFSQAFDFTAYDGRTDFDGTSGGTTGLVERSAGDYFLTHSASDFALFSAAGGGLIDLGMSAKGTTSSTGPGNLVTGFTTSAAGFASITYEYTPFVVEVPEPASMATLLAGLGLMGAVRRRRASKK